ncbi:MAG: phenylalanine--tRNA ligase subunit beta [Pseudomonadota bacterium]
MRVSEKWLREWVDPRVDTAALAHRLTMAGLEVDAVEPVAGEFTGVVVAMIRDCRPHPEADKLRICEVDDGGDGVSIVCGAANARAGLRVPLARVGAELPGGLTIKATKLRGEPSHGMLCSAAELGLAESADGLLELPADAPVGRDLRDVLELDDHAIEIDLTPNRGDCLSVVGLAREIGALYGVPVCELDPEPEVATHGHGVAVTVKDPAACPRYLSRTIRGIDPAAESPLWLRERLRRSGLRDHGAVVDITNYVLLELGQPLHAFDAARLSGGLTVRRAAAGESLALLNEQTVELDAETLVIADDAGPVAMAGIMGGADSAVGDETTDIVLECAFFNPEAVAGRARRFGLHTDSSHRYERGVDPAITRLAMERVTALIRQIAGGQAGPVVEVDEPSHLPSREPIPLRRDRIEELLGLAVEDELVIGGLGRLGAREQQQMDGWLVVPPTHRFDLHREEDLVEEVARLVGYDHLPSALPEAPMVAAEASEARIPLTRLRRRLAARDFHEAITYSFVEPGLQERVDPDAGALALANPISSELGAMRTSLWPGLIQAAQYNRQRQRNRIRLFETGLRFRRRVGEGAIMDDLEQTPMVAALATGPAVPEQWGEAGRAADFFDLKAELETLIEATGAAEAFAFEAAEHPGLHPGQSARVWRDGHPVGWLGTLHPAIAEELDFTDPVVLFELESAALTTARCPAYRAPSRYPAIRRDLAVVVDEAVTAEALLAVVREAAGPLLRDSRVFDVYRGKGVDSGRKSLAVGLTLQDDSRTLIDADVEEIVSRVVADLARRLDAVLRD